MIEDIKDKIDRLKEDHAKWVEADGKPLAAQAVSARENLLADVRPARVANFSKNITLFFDGPKTYPAINSSAAKSKNKLPLLRCEQIRCLGPYGIISWAAAFAPTACAGGGKIPDHAFDYLINNIEPEGFQGWPLEIAEIPSGFAAKKPLRQSDSYSPLYVKMKGYNSDKQVALYDCSIPTKDLVIPQKRKHIKEEQGIVPIQTSRREQKSAAIINNAFLTIHT